MKDSAREPYAPSLLPPVPCFGLKTLILGIIGGVKVAFSKNKKKNRN
jgi:hypothetical protein